MHPTRNRGTAKKFLAAANFLEILRTFDKEKPDAVTPTPDSTEEKIRYAKWKAADIAKAFREGRKPTPGPAGSEPEVAVSPEFPPAEAPIITRTTPPPPAITDMPGPPQDGFFQQPPPPAHVPDELLAHTLPGASSVQSPAWSTAATPGTPGRPLDAAASRSNHKVQVSGELEGRSDGSITPVEGSPSRKEVRFTPSVAGGTSPPTNLSTLPPTADPEQTGLPPGFVPEAIMPDPSAPPLEDVPPGFVPATSPVGGEHDLYQAGSPGHPRIPPPSGVPYSPPRPPPGPLSPDAHIAPSAPPVIPPPAPIAPSPIVPVAPLPAPVIPVPPAPVVSVAPAPPVPVFDATVTAVPVELTPQVIARAQKHCRFAISALDYEDAEQARKELRAALRMLGG